MSSTPLVLAFVFLQVVFTNAETTCTPQELEQKQLWDFFKAQEQVNDDNYAIVPGLLPYIPWDCDGVRQKRHLKVFKRPNIVKKQEGHRHKRWFVRQACAKGYTRVGGRCYQRPRWARSTDHVSRSKRSYLASTRFLCPLGFVRRKYKCVPSHFKFGLG